MTQTGYFAKENIGCFYGIFETRPYIRGLYENDNTGARYFLMAIYAYLEEEKEILELYKKYLEENFGMLYSLFVLYYKLGNEKKANAYLKRANKANPSLIKFFKGTLTDKDKAHHDYYQIGTASEIMMYYTNYVFLTDTIPTIEYYILEKFKIK